MPFKRNDIESLRRLVHKAVDELPESLRPTPHDARLTSSEYGHWSRRIPKYALVDIGSQRATNPTG